jgi:hypothetical protein
MIVSILVFLLVLVALNAWLGLVRNNQVHGFRRAMLDELHDIAVDEIAHGEFHLWKVRFKAMEQTSYESMTLQFWRAPESFYRGTILEKIAVDAARRTAL